MWHSGVQYIKKLANMRVEYDKFIENFSMPSYHFHNEYEIYYLLSGERKHFIKDRNYHVTQGSIVLINKNELHKTTSVIPNHERILIYFTDSFLAQYAHLTGDMDLLSCFKKCTNVYNLGINERNYVEGLLFDIIDESKKEYPGFELCCELSLLRLLIFLTRYTDIHQVDRNEHHDSLHRKVSEIVSYINKNYAEDLSLSVISRKFYISASYLSKIFKESTGFTLTEYLNSIRIKEAQRLLRETNLNVSKIAEKVGYDNITHFVRMFKLISGCTALKYRKKAQQNMALLTKT